MSNEVEIVVVSRDKTDFTSIATKAKGAGSASGKNFGEGLEKETVRGIESMGKKITSGGLKTGAELGQNIGSSAVGGITSALEATGPGGAAVGAAILGVGAAAAPALGALLSAAVIGGAGVGGIIGGILLVKDDPRVNSAATAVSATIMKSLKTSAEPFVTPVIDGLHTIESAFSSSAGNFSNIFKNASAWIGPLADVAADAIDSISGGLSDLTDGAGPVMEALTNGISEVADSIGDGFSSLGDDGAAAGAVLQEVFDAVSRTLDAVFWVVDKLSVAFGWLAEHGYLGSHIKDSYEDFKDELSEAADAQDHLNDSTQSATASIQEQADALKAQYDPAFALIDAQSQLAKAQDEYQAAVAKSGASSADAQHKLTAVAKAALGLTDATAAASDTFTGQLTPALEQVLRTAGFGDKEIAAFRKQLASAESQAGRTAGSLVLTAGQARNLASAVRSAASALAALHSKTVNVNIDYNIRTFGKPFSTSGATGIGGNNYTGHAAGGVVGAAASGGPQGAWTLVGEEGPEIVNLPIGSQVTPASQTRQQMSDMGGGQGSGGGTLQIAFTGNTDTVMATAFIKMFNAGNIRIRPQWIGS